MTYIRLRSSWPRLKADFLFYAILKAMGDVKGVKAGQSENEMLLVDADGNVLMVLSKN